MFIVNLLEACTVKRRTCCIGSRYVLIHMVLYVKMFSTMFIIVITVVLFQQHKIK